MKTWVEKHDSDLIKTYICIIYTIDNQNGKVFKTNKYFNQSIVAC